MPHFEKAANSMNAPYVSTRTTFPLQIVFTSGIRLSRRPPPPHHPPPPPPRLTSPPPPHCKPPAPSGRGVWHRKQSCFDANTFAWYFWTSPIAIPLRGGTSPTAATTCSVVPINLWRLPLSAARRANASAPLRFSFRLYSATASSASSCAISAALLTGAYNRSYIHP